MKLRETHANGATFEAAGRRAHLVPLLAGWRDGQRPAEASEEMPEPEGPFGTNALVEHAGRRAYESVGPYGGQDVPIIQASATRPPFGFTLNPEKGAA